LYLIDDCEAQGLAGTAAALAEESYTLPHVAVFSSELLRDWFRRNGAGVYAAGTDAGDAAACVLAPGLTSRPRPRPDDLAPRSPRGLLFHARPQAEAGRSLYELGVLALAEAVRGGVFEGAWRFDAVGGIDTGTRVALGRGAWLRLLAPQEVPHYADFLAAH